MDTNLEPDVSRPCPHLFYCHSQLLTSSFFPYSHPCRFGSHPSRFRLFSGCNLTPSFLDGPISQNIDFLKVDARPVDDERLAISAVNAARWMDVARC